MAIKKFFKDMFMVEVEETVPQEEQKPGEREEARTEQKQSNVTKLSESRRGRGEALATAPAKDGQAGKVKQTGDSDKEKSKEPLFKRDKQKPQNRTQTAGQNKRETKEKTLMEAPDTNAKVHLFEPRVFSETQDIADELKEERSALVNLSKVDSAAKKRIVDFMSGTVYALDGDIQKVGQDIFLCTPNSVSVEGEITGEKEFNEET